MSQSPSVREGQQHCVVIMDMSLNCKIHCVYSNKVVDNVMIIFCQQAFTVQPIERYNLDRIS